MRGCSPISHYPFFSDRMNVPDGVNLDGQHLRTVRFVANDADHPAVRAARGIPGLSHRRLIATATAWYFVLSRVLIGSRGPAWLGARFCAFAPAMVSHANGHPNIVSQFVVPLIVWRTLRLRRTAAAGCATASCSGW